MNLNHLTVFLAVAEARSYTRAAEKLGCDKGYVSRVVRALESSLGVVLFSRTTRKVELTPAGEDLAAKTAPAISELLRVGASVADRPETPAGLVSLTAPPDIGRALLAPLLPALRRRYHALRVRLVLEADVVPLAEARVDLALRVGRVGEEGVRIRRLGELEAGFFAAPRYLAARGTPKTEAELREHDGIWPSRPPKKTFGSNEKVIQPVFDCDDFGTSLELARTGGGVAVLPLHLARRDLRDGSLVRIVPHVTLRGAPLFLVMRKEKPLPPRVSAMRDFLVFEVPRALLG